MFPTMALLMFGSARFLSIAVCCSLFVSCLPRFVSDIRAACSSSVFFCADICDVFVLANFHVFVSRIRCALCYFCVDLRVFAQPYNVSLSLYIALFVCSLPCFTVICCLSPHDA